MRFGSVRDALEERLQPLGERAGVAVPPCEEDRMHERLELVAHLLQSPCRGAAARCAAGPHTSLALRDHLLPTDRQVLRKNKVAAAAA